MDCLKKPPESSLAAFDHGKGIRNLESRLNLGLHGWTLSGRGPPHKKAWTIWAQ